MLKVEHPLWTQARPYLQLMRLDRPVGIYLLLWPTLWALWIAAAGPPSLDNLFIFIGGVIVMRSAGCVINDFADRNFDGQVARTRHRPLASGQLAPHQALILFALLCVLAFTLVLFTNWLTIKLSLLALALASIYPFMKRFTYLPQVVLGAAFSMAIPMAFAAELQTVPTQAWLLYCANLIWTVAYDSLYAMADRDEDLKAGIKSSAILFGDLDRLMIGILQALSLLLLGFLGQQIDAQWPYYLALAGVMGLFTYQQRLIIEREKQACLTAFMNNKWVGVVVFIGLVSHYLLAPAPR